MSGTRLLEREEELRLLEGAIDAGAGGDGRLVLVEGEAGIGKTSLLEAGSAMAEERGFLVLGGRGGMLERGVGFGVVRQLLEATVVRARPAERRALLAGSALLAAPVLGLESGTISGAASGEELASMHGLYWLACNLAERQPLLLVVDDLHWCDEISLRWLLYLAQRIEGLRVTVLLAVRSDEPAAEPELLPTLATEPAVTVVRPPPLSEEATAALLARVCGEAVEPELGRACREWTRGNPWFVAELGAELAAVGLLDGENELARLRELTPEGVARVTLLRLQRLPEPALELARAVAVLGSDAELRQAAALAGLGEDAAVAACDRLIETRVLEPCRPLRFVHPLVRGIVYDALPPARRGADHLRAARLLDGEGAAPEPVAAHLLLSQPRGQEWVVERLCAVAESERARGSHAAAAALLGRAVEEPPAPPARAELLFELGKAQLLAHDPAALATLERALATASGPRARAGVAIPLARLLVFAGRAREALALLDEALLDLALGNEERLELEALRLAAARSDLELLDVAEEQAARLAATPRPASRGGRMIDSLLAYQAAIGGESAAATADLARLALADGRLLHDSLDSPDAAIVSISMLAICDELEEAEDRYAEAMELGRETGRVLGFALASCLRSWCSHLRGRLADAELQARDALALAAASPTFAAAVGGFATAHLAQTLVERGELEEAAALLAGEGADPDAAPMTWRRSLLFADGALRLAQGRDEEAAELLLACGDLHATAGIVNPAIVAWRSEAALALRRLGDEQRARELAREELVLARRFGARRSIGVALRAAGLVEGGESGLGMLAESVAVLRESPARLELARATAAHGAALRRAGNRAQARELLGESLDLALACGMEPLAEEARGELRLLGSRPRSELRSGAAALTPAERRVAEMAVAGMSNPEIAQALFVTRATVESHLHAAYRKLGIGSRRQLQEALGESQ